MPSQKVLYILRHAKAETGAPTQDDHDRALMPRGIDAAHAMGEFFTRQGVRPERVLCSTALRARQTWEQVRETYRTELPVDYSDRLYLASANETINLIAQTTESISRLLVVGHNPGLHQLCLKLAHDGKADILDTLAIKFPTCALASIALGDVAWRDIAQARGELKGFTTPSMLSVDTD